MRTPPTKGMQENLTGEGGGGGWLTSQEIQMGQGFWTYTYILDRELRSSMSPSFWKTAMRFQILLFFQTAAL